jgi:hypothetical protein
VTVSCITRETLRASHRRDGFRCLTIEPPFRAGTFPGVIVSVNGNGTFDIDVTIVGMGNIDGRAKHGTSRFVDDAAHDH